MVENSDGLIRGEQLQPLAASFSDKIIEDLWLLISQLPVSRKAQILQKLQTELAQTGCEGSDSVKKLAEKAHNARRMNTAEVADELEKLSEQFQRRAAKK